MDFISYILFPSKQICQGKSFQRHAQLSASPPLTRSGTETVELIAINCDSIEEIPACVNAIASTALAKSYSEENLFNALWSDVTSRHMFFKPYGSTMPDYFDDMFIKNNIEVRREGCIYIRFEKETLDIVTRFTENKLKKNLQ